jgi:hypothetical protein
VEYRRLHNHTASVAPGFEMRSKCPSARPGWLVDRMMVLTEPVRSSPPPSSSGPASHIPRWHSLVLKDVGVCYQTQGALRH